MKPFALLVLGLALLLSGCCTTTGPKPAQPEVEVQLDGPFTFSWPGY